MNQLPLILSRCRNGVIVIFACASCGADQSGPPSPPAYVDGWHELTFANESTLPLYLGSRIESDYLGRTGNVENRAYRVLLGLHQSGIYAVHLYLESRCTGPWDWCGEPYFRSSAVRSECGTWHYNPPHLVLNSKDRSDYFRIALRPGSGKAEGSRLIIDGDISVWRGSDPNTLPTTYIFEAGAAYSFPINCDP